MNINSEVFLSLPANCILKVNSLEKYIRKVKKITDPWRKSDDPVTIPWFRGQKRSNKDYSLIPSVFRKDYDEFWMNTLFRNRATALGNMPETDRLDKWLLYMRHYELPTRLLDWNESPLFALYFALRNFNTEQIANKIIDSSEYYESCPAVWVIEPLALNDFSIGSHSFPNTWNNKNIGFRYFNLAFEQWDRIEELKNIQQKVNNNFEEIKNKLDKLYNNKKIESLLKYKKHQYLRLCYPYPYPIAVQPSYSDYRMLAQRSVVTIHGLIKKDFETLLTGTKFIKKGYFKKIIITSKHEEILRDLKDLGINESVVYPDPKGYATALKDWLVKK